jgi:hypothetical protein
VSRPLLLTVTTAFLFATLALVSIILRTEPLSITQKLPVSEQRFLEFLLLLPVAALICAAARNIIGIHTFGTFAPALLGLAFREMDSLLGLFLLLTVLSIGWVVRRALSRFNLLQIPRSAVMLSVIVGLLVAFVLWSNANGKPVAEAIPLLPMVIVTGLIERFWTAEEEDGTGTAVRTMLFTLLTAALVFVVARIEIVGQCLLAYPESLGFVIALQLLIGRYTGYRCTELARFRGLAEMPEGTTP